MYICIPHTSLGEITKRNKVDENQSMATIVEEKFKLRKKDKR